MYTLGNLYALICQSYFAPKPEWTTADIPDLTGKVIIVTGGNSGIGKETVKALVEHNAKVYIMARTRKSAEAVIEQIYKETQKTSYFIPLDLADLSSVKASVAEFMRREEQLHILFNNGGVMAPPIEQTTSAGHDMCFGVNVLGHFFLTKLLMPALMAAFRSSGEKSRVVNTSSCGVYLANNIDFSTFTDCPLRRKKSYIYLYCQSKWGNVVYAKEFARRYGNEGIVCTSVNPGNVKDTGLNSHLTSGKESWMLWALQIHPPQWGALTQLYAGTSLDGAGFNGMFLIPWARLGKPAPSTNDPEMGRKLWEWMEAQVVDV
ncbi:NAD(P)-binding protein [Mycena polygramma]|nr:NAD(P)-binding protein [Mycena polygramma]